MGIHKPTAPAVNLSHYPNDTLDTDNCYPSNSMQPTFVGDGTLSGDTFSTGQIYASGFIARADFTCDGIACESWAGAAGVKMVMGIWQSDGDGQPTSLQGQTAEITLDSSATVRIAATASDVNITKGLYWVGFSTDTNAQFIKDTPGTNHKAFQTNYGNVIWAGGNFAVNNYGLCWKKAFTYNSTLPTISSPTWNSFGPGMALRVK